MRNILATLALAAVPALLLSACNGSAGGTGLSRCPMHPLRAHRHHVHRLDTAADLHAGGATFPAYGYNLGNQPVGIGQSARAAARTRFALRLVRRNRNDLLLPDWQRLRTQRVRGEQRHRYHGLRGSRGPAPVGFGARQDPLDFVGSDVAMASTECCASGTPTTTAASRPRPSLRPALRDPGLRRSDRLRLPSERLQGVRTRQLSTWTYCAIANGTIGNWNDAAITADNGGNSVTGGSRRRSLLLSAPTAAAPVIFTNHLNDRVQRISSRQPYNTAAVRLAEP